jgi:predicted metal-dependent peptidase
VVCEKPGVAVAFGCMHARIDQCLKKLQVAWSTLFWRGLFSVQRGLRKTTTRVSGLCAVSGWF